MYVYVSPKNINKPAMHPQFIIDMTVIDITHTALRMLLFIRLECKALMLLFPPQYRVLHDNIPTI